MPVDLIGAVVAWLVATAGDAGLQQIRRARDKRKLRAAVETALRPVIDQVDPALRAGLEGALAACFAEPISLHADGVTPIDALLRSAITARVMRLERWKYADSGRLFLEETPVDIDWLAEHVTNAIISAMRQVVALGGLPELVHGVDQAATASQLAQVREQLGKLTDASEATAASLVAARPQMPVGQATSTPALPGPAQPARSGAGLPDAADSKAAWRAALLKFSDIDDPEFRRAVLRMMGERLGLGGIFEAAYRSMARDHVFEIIERCWTFGDGMSTDRRTALRALGESLISLRPNDQATGNLTRLMAETL